MAEALGLLPSQIVDTTNLLVFTRSIDITPASNPVATPTSQAVGHTFYDSTNIIIVNKCGILKWVNGSIVSQGIGTANKKDTYLRPIITQKTTDDNIFLGYLAEDSYLAIFDPNSSATYTFPEVAVLVNPGTYRVGVEITATPSASGISPKSQNTFYGSFILFYF